MQDSASHSHAAPKGTIIGSYVALLFFTAIMVGLSRLNVDKFGIDWLNLHAIRTSLIMGTALIMGIIVSMFLMGLRYESKLLNLTIFLSNFVFLLIFVLFTWVDTSFRGEVDPTFNEKINWTSPVKPAEEEAKTEAGAPAAAMPAAAASEAPASAQPAQPADSTVHKAEDAEAKKNASAAAPQNPAQAKPENPAQATHPAKSSAPQKNPPSPNPAKPEPAGKTEAPKQPAPAGH